MNSCIYLFDKEKDLTYEKKEHIFSAGIGGRHTLPTGYVSDQANELFSSYELKCLRYSPLMIARAKYGPGKRGSFNVNHIDVPDVLSLKPETEAKERDVICPLGFLFMDQAYPIPQMIIMLDGILARPKKLYIKPQYETFLKTNMESFPIQLKQFLLTEKRRYKLVDILYDTRRSFVCIGCYKKTWYISSTIADFDIQKCAKQILEAEWSIDLCPKYLSGKPMFRYNRKIALDDMIPAFIHAKNCFNVLASFKGTHFMQHQLFDQFRRCILTNTEWESVILPCTLLPKEIRRWADRNIPNKDHAVAIYTEGEVILGFSVLYGEAYGLFKLGEGYCGGPFSCGVVCLLNEKQEIRYDSIA